MINFLPDRHRANESSHYKSMHHRPLDLSVQAEGYLAVPMIAICCHNSTSGSETPHAANSTDRGHLVQTLISDNIFPHFSHKTIVSDTDYYAMYPTYYLSEHSIRLCQRFLPPHSGQTR